MKAPVPPPERQTPFPLLKAEPGAQHSEEHEYKPRYVALPKHWERGHGRRNLITGVALFCAAGVLLAWAVFLAGALAILTLGVCVATTTLLMIMARSRLFRQRNGAFLGWAMVCLFGVFLVILYQGYLLLTGGVHPATMAGAPGSIPVATVAPLPSARDAAAPLLREAFPNSQAPADSPATIRMTQDLAVTIDNKRYLAKAGEIYPLADIGIGEVHFMVNDKEVTVPSAAAEVAGADLPAPVDARPLGSLPRASVGGFKKPVAQEENEKTGPTMTVAQAHREAIRRYPNLAVKGSAENSLFVSAYNEQKHTGQTEFFDDPSWPLALAEILAEKDGWKRADLASQTPALSGDEASSATSSPSGFRGTSGSPGLR